MHPLRRVTEVSLISYQWLHSSSSSTFLDERCWGGLLFFFGSKCAYKKNNKRRYLLLCVCQLPCSCSSISTLANTATVPYNIVWPSVRSSVRRRQYINWIINALNPTRNVISSLSVLFTSFRSSLLFAGYFNLRIRLLFLVLVTIQLSSTSTMASPVRRPWNNPCNIDFEASSASSYNIGIQSKDAKKLYDRIMKSAQDVMKENERIKEKFVSNCQNSFSFVVRHLHPYLKVVSSCCCTLSLSDYLLYFCSWYTFTTTTLTLDVYSTL